MGESRRRVNREARELLASLMPEILRENLGRVPVDPYNLMEDVDDLRAGLKVRKDQLSGHRKLTWKQLAERKDVESLQARAERLRAALRCLSQADLAALCGELVAWEVLSA